MPAVSVTITMNNVYMAPVSEFVADLVIATRIDSARVVNVAASTVSGTTEVTFQVLPRTRQGQVLSDDVGRIITSTLLNENSAVLTGDAQLTGILDQLSTVRTVPNVNVTFCPDRSAFLSVCPAPTSPPLITLAFVLNVSMVLGAFLGGMVPGACCIGLLSRRWRRRRPPTDAQWSRPVPYGTQTGPSSAASSVNNNNNNNNVPSMKALRAGMSSPPPMAHVTSSFRQPDQVHRESAPVVRMERKRAAAAVAATGRSKSSSAQAARSASAVGSSRAAKKWDAERLANPWIAKDMDASDFEI